MSSLEGCFVRTRIACAACALFMTGSASALSRDYGGVSVRLDTRLTESLALRTEAPAANLVGIANGGTAYSVNADDADLAYSKGSLVAAVTRLTPALSVTWKDYGFVAQANYSYDPRIDGKNFFDPDDFGAGHQYPQSTRRHANQQTHDHVGSRFTPLDLYAFGDFKIFGHALTVKAGQQTVRWGESFLVLNGLNSIQAYDANKATTPAFEIDEVSRPYPQIVGTIDLWARLSLEAWYQLQWKPTILPYAGTFLVTNDYVVPGAIGGNIDFGRAGEYAAAGSSCHDTNLFPASVAFPCVPYGGSIPRGGDRDARDRGQFGLALSGVIGSLRDLSFTLYGANYHSRLPLFSSISASSGNLDAGTARVIGEYPEDIHLFGASFNGVGPWGFALQGEVSYKPNQPLELDDVEQSLADLGAPSQIDPVAGQTLGNQYIRGWRRHQVSLWDLSTTKILPPNATLRYDELLILFEAGLVRVHDLESNDELRYEGPGTFLPGDAAAAAQQGVPVQHGGFATATSYGLNLLVRASYNNVMSGLQCNPGLRWTQGLHGTTPAPLLDFVEDATLLNPGVQFVYNNNASLDLGYTRFFGAGQSNLLRDRDFVSLDFKYSF